LLSVNPVSSNFRSVIFIAFVIIFESRKIFKVTKEVWQDIIVQGMENVMTPWELAIVMSNGTLSIVL
jgi:hypothetical protein